METFRGALFGFGFIAEHGHVPAYEALSSASTPARLEIAAVADICADRRSLAATRLPHARIYDDPLRLLQEERGRLDFVDICTPPYAHGPLAMQALEFDLHVLCEKPIATRSKEASRVLATAQRKGRVLFPCHNYQHAPVIQAVRNLLSQDTIGPVHLVTLDTFRNTHALGVAEWREHWRRERRWSGGGIAMDHGSHTFYLAFDWLESYPTAISASATRRPPFDTEDTLACQLTFPSGVAMARMTWAAGMRRALYTLHGPRGAISVDDDHIRLSTMSSAVPSKASNIGPIQWSVREMVAPSAWDNPGHPEWFVAHLVRFAQVLREGTCLPKETLDAWQCLRVIEAAYASSDEGSRTVVLPPTEDPRTWSMH